jgi:hypothetical protein
MIVVVSTTSRMSPGAFHKGAKGHELDVGEGDGPAAKRGPVA